MAEKKTQPIVVDGVEYDFNEMTQEQQALVNHCVDLDRKIQSAAFNLDQLRVGKDAFLNLLKNSLTAQPAVETVETAQ